MQCSQSYCRVSVLLFDVWKVEFRYVAEGIGVNVHWSVTWRQWYGHGLQGIDYLDHAHIFKRSIENKDSMQKISNIFDPSLQNKRSVQRSVYFKNHSSFIYCSAQRKII